ncbi:HET-domain-containing protein [Pseudovirgaria hyperparasitica]|uniref:HET-domain-containing protein n=1 Tax=Pseudovirgaria hyperparasitica TaxID=470096 RepID=A0A6A6WDS3_9PEZI|nr:HET-domain-containing protein [Pseudovirgaria hyperparasitica]KAF2760968.1 HET-domain-containing protein [Pseudovirgaria hyperparasitica]
MGDSALARLCSTCRALDISPAKFYSHSSIPSNNTEGHAVRIGYLDDLFKRRHDCTFCDLLCDAIYTPQNEEIVFDGFDVQGDRVNCFMDWPQKSQLDRNRRLRIFSDESIFTPAYIALLNDHNPSRTQASASVDLDEVRSWIRECEHSHDKSCQMYCTRDRSLPKLRVIDTELRCLVEKQTPLKYCALSYVWGSNGSQPAPLVLTKQNLAALEQPGAFLDDHQTLPKTVRDAVDIAFRLGVQYLWVDSLCILQDSLEDFHKTAPFMDTVYGQAVLTICAASSDYANAGIFGPDSMSRAFIRTSGSYGPLRLGVMKTLRDQIISSRWNHRGWTFQEKVLSTRALVFVDEDVFYECGRSRKKVGSRLSADEIQALSTMGSPSSLCTPQQNPIDRLSKHVEIYSHRELAFSRDRLLAFEGVLGALSNAADSRKSGLIFCYGLPKSHFDWSLLWEPKGLSRRLPLEERAGSILPSWSWCGWSGASWWNPGTTFQPRSDLHQWLAQNTWVIWWIGADSSHDLVLSTGEGSSEGGVSQDEVDGTIKWYGYRQTNVDNVDFFGRTLRREWQLNNEDFPNYPTHDPIEGCLNFCTWSAHFSLSPGLGSRESGPYWNSLAQVAFNVAPGVYKRSLLDRSGQWCGEVILNDSNSNYDCEVFEFLAISDAQAGILGIAYYALMICWIQPETLAERVGLARIHTDAFHKGSLEPGLQWKEITLG